MTKDCTYGKIRNCPKLGDCEFSAEEGVSPIGLENPGRKFYRPSEILYFVIKLKTTSNVWVNKDEIIACVPSQASVSLYKIEKEKHPDYPPY
jgi:hypothetical protein